MSDSTSQKKDMSFLDHLEELRGRIFHSLIAIIIVGIVCAIYVDELVNNILFYHHNQLDLKVQVLTPYGIVLLYMEVVITSAIIFSMPIILWQVWKFISPALLQKERKYIFWITFFTSFCFCRCRFRIFILIPTSMNFSRISEQR